MVFVENCFSLQLEKINVYGKFQCGFDDFFSESVVETYSAYDEINRGTVNRPRPLLKFHTVHGENVELLQDGRIARRKDSFCKGLVFSNRWVFFGNFFGDY